MPVRIGRYRSSLAAAAAAADTSIEVVSAAGLPALASGDYVYLTLADPNETALEVVRVDAISGTTLTVRRAQSDTTARLWPAGTAAVLSNDPLTLREFVEEHGGSLEDIAPFARANASWGDLDGVGPADVTDGARLTIQKEDETDVDHITFGALSAKVGEDISGPQGGISASTARNIANTQIAALRPNAFTTADETKLDGIEAGAKDDQSASRSAGRCVRVRRQP